MELLVKIVNRVLASSQRFDKVPLLKLEINLENVIAAKLGNELFI